MGFGWSTSADTFVGCFVGSSLKGKKQGKIKPRGCSHGGFRGALLGGPVGPLVGPLGGAKRIVRLIWGGKLWSAPQNPLLEASESGIGLCPFPPKNDME